MDQHELRSGVRNRVSYTITADAISEAPLWKINLQDHMTEKEFPDRGIPFFVKKAVLQRFLT